MKDPAEKELIFVDIVYMSGRHGGFENQLNIAGSYLCRHGFRVRFVQMVSSGIDWSAPEIEFLCLDLSRESFSYDTAKKAYAGLLLSDGKLPDLIIATGWPNMIYITKGATADIGKPIPVCAWPHDDLDYYRVGGSGDVSILEHADMCFAINDKIADDILQAFPDKVVYRVNNTVNTEHVCYSENRNTRKLACVGRLTDKKAVSFILYAMELTKDPWELVIVGEGEEEKSLRKLARKLHLENNIRFAGWKEHPWEILTDCRALVMASLYEGAPLVTIEALACGMQVISTPVGFLPELIEEGVNGYLWTFGKPQELTDILDRIAKEPFTAEQVRACKSSTRDYLPEQTLFDFLCKGYACVKCRALPQRCGNGNRDLYLTPERPFANESEERQYLDMICSQEYYDRQTAAHSRSGTASASSASYPLISVIIPCYNSGQYVAACIDSVLTQSWPSDKIQIILINDASADQTLSVLQEYEKQYPDRIIIIDLEQNMGQGAARNIGMEYADGEYLMFVDSDDTVHPDILSELFRASSAYDCDVARCGYQIFSDSGKEPPLTMPEKLYITEFDKTEKRRLLIDHGFQYGNTPCAKLYKTSFLHENNIFFPENTKMEDIAFHEETLCKARRYYAMNRVYYHYRQNLNGTMFSPRAVNYFMDTFYVQKWVYEKLREEGLTADFEEEFAYIFYEKGFVTPVEFMLYGEGLVSWDAEKIDMMRSVLLSYFPHIRNNSYILSHMTTEKERVWHIFTDTDHE